MTLETVRETLNRYRHDADDISSWPKTLEQFEEIGEQTC